MFGSYISIDYLVKMWQKNVIYDLINVMMMSRSFLPWVVPVIVGSTWIDAANKACHSWLWGHIEEESRVAGGQACDQVSHLER